MSDEEDDRLRAAFRHLKAHDRRRAPSFEASRSAPKRRPIRTVWLVTGPLLAAAAVLVAVCSAPSSDDTSRPMASAPPTTAAGAPGAGPSPPSDARLGAARPDPLPLDFLLDDSFLSSKSSRSFLSHVPDFDSDFSKGSVR